jgi:crotonobetainyl-CoA:carnitine CoA-transferase CaiB-like acyl-CoA transferase
LGEIEMQDVLARLSASPGSVKWTGRELGADNQDVYSNQLNLSEEKIAELRNKRII